MKYLIIGLLAVGAGLAGPRASTAQETPPPPSVATVLANLRADRAVNIRQAVEILTQQHGHRPQGELDTFADSLVAMVIAGGLSDAPGRRASVALQLSASPEAEGAIPYAGAYDALARIFAETKSYADLRPMADVDPHRTLPLVLELVRMDDYVACSARMALLKMEGGEEMTEELRESGALVHWCPGDGLREEITFQANQWPESLRNDVLAKLRTGDETGIEQAVAILTQQDGDWWSTDLDEFADSLVTLASSGNGTSPSAGRVLDVLEQSSRTIPLDLDAQTVWTAHAYVSAYGAVARVFEATGSRAALESLARIDPGRAATFLVEVASRDDPISCTARTVLEGMDRGRRLLRELEAAGTLAYRCPSGM